MAAVSSWRADEEAWAQAEKVEVEQEIRNLQAAIQNLQNQLDGLHRKGAELDAKKAALPAKEFERGHAGVIGALQAQAQALGQRDLEVGQAAKDRAAAAAARLAESDIAGTVEEYRQFKTTVEPTLAALPESYRGIILKHHDTVVARLRDVFTQLESSAPHLEKDDLAAEVVWAVDAPDGAPELLVCILPVSDQVHDRWHERDEGVQLWLAARVVQAIYSAGAASGVDGLHAMAGGHEGLLVLECDVTGASGAFPDTLAARLTDLFGRARELGGARVTVTPVKVEMDVLLPPQDEEEGDAG